MPGRAREASNLCRAGLMGWPYIGQSSANVNGKGIVIGRRRSASAAP